MKQSLDLRLGQHLTITPQLQQAIRLLQLSSAELQQEIQEALETNPLLEERELGEPENKGENGEAPGEPSETASSGDEEFTAADVTMERGTIEESSDGDSASDGSESDWAELFDSSKISSSSSTRSDDDMPDIDARNSLPTTLRDHLSWQMQMTPFSEADKPIAQALIDAINDEGYLTCSLEDVQQALAKIGSEVEVDEIEAVLHQIQNYDPVGVGARDLAECLRLQMKGMAPEACPDLKSAQAIATTENLALLANRDYAALRRVLKISADELQRVVQFIQRLNPRPGLTVKSAPANYVVPDVIVKKFRGVWRAELNPDISPRLRINRQYERMIHRGDSSAQNKYLQEQLQQARWFIKSVTSRNDTLLKVARTIVDHQRSFFDHGPEAMKPLVLHDVAEAVDMHESTVSRVTTNKYMLTPRGVFELKYFFSSHVATADGGTCSSVAIRSLIKKLVETEAGQKPISDSKIAEILANQGINVARRTVAKYRESMNIPPSNQRKSLV
ncbi:MAG TPA: RNA polymerase factor sigma-54 [Burkholderiales bacterium]|nr:RNA polymerase factor sigma-54 [Burkholderiales bacterium]